MKMLAKSFVFGIVAAIALCVSVAGLLKSNDIPSLESELARLQSHSGQMIVQLEGDSIDVLLFGNQDLTPVPLPQPTNVSGGMISPDGEEIAFRQAVPSRALTDQNVRAGGLGTILSVVQTDGRHLRRFSQVEDPIDLCWSPDRKWLAFVSFITTGATNAPGHELQVLNLNSGKIIAIVVGASVSYQCWNELGTALVFTKGGTLRVFNVEDKTTRTLSTGNKATWSPDGRLIAFRRGDSFYAITPSGSGEKLLFQRKKALTPLWWSPNLDFVYYVHEPSLWHTSWHIPDELDLRVRRFADRKEVVAYRFSGKGRPLGFQWVTNSRLFIKASSSSHR